jgi:hypothetical protein
MERRCRATIAHDPSRSVDHLASAVAWPIEEALPPGAHIGDMADPTFSRQAHENAIRAMLRSLRSA